VPACSDSPSNHTHTDHRQRRCVYNGVLQGSAGAQQCCRFRLSFSNATPATRVKRPLAGGKALIAYTRARVCTLSSAPRPNDFASPSIACIYRRICSEKASTQTELETGPRRRSATCGAGARKTSCPSIFSSTSPGSRTPSADAPSHTVCTYRLLSGFMATIIPMPARASFFCDCSGPFAPRSLKSCFCTFTQQFHAHLVTEARAQQGGRWSQIGPDARAVQENTAHTNDKWGGNFSRAALDGIGPMEQVHIGSERGRSLESLIPKAADSMSLSRLSWGHKGTRRSDPSPHLADAPFLGEDGADQTLSCSRTQGHPVENSCPGRLALCCLAPLFQS
jgi:hypothetical protein